MPTQFFDSTHRDLNLNGDYGLFNASEKLTEPGFTFTFSAAYSVVEFLGKISSEALRAISGYDIAQSHVEFGRSSVMSVAEDDPLEFQNAFDSKFVFRGKVQSNDDAIYFGGGGNRIINWGLIVGDDGIRFGTSEDTGLSYGVIDDNNVLINWGKIRAEGNGILSDTDQTTVRNFGVIQGKTSRLDPDAGKAGIDIDGNSSLGISSTGHVLQAGKIVNMDYGILSGAEMTWIENKGLINVRFEGINTDALDLENSGKIIAGYSAVLASQFVTINNSGLLQSESNDVISLSAGAVIYNSGTIRAGKSGGEYEWAIDSNGGGAPGEVAVVINIGKIFGNVELGDADDHFENVGNALHDGWVEGGYGNDTLIAGKRAVNFDGESGNDVLYDSRKGDVLAGGSNNDKIHISGGNDKIDGGSGFDSFIFSGKALGRNTIDDFSHGDDVIDLSAFGISLEQQGKILGNWSKVNAAGDTVIDLFKVTGIKSGVIVLKDFSADLQANDFLWVEI